MGKIKKKRNKKYNRVFMNTPTEYSVIFVVLFLVVFGIIMVYSSSFYASVSRQSLEPYVKQSLFAFIGLVMMMIISRIQITFLNKFIALGYLLTLFLLVFVLLIADDVKGAKRWIPVGGFNLQPSEIAKFAVILTLALLLTLFKKHLSEPKVLLVLGITVAIPLALIAKEDLSAGVVFLVICGAMLFVAYRHIIKLFVFAIILMAMGSGFVLLSSYRMDRIKTYLDGPWSDPEGAGRQIIQSLYAIGSGGLTGIGLGQSMQKMGYISEAHNDIIFAIICEELGLLGGVAIIGLYIVLIYRIAQISISAKSMEHYLVGIGVMTHIGIQAFINIGVATNLIPTTGMPLPFISYGGSSLIMLLVEIGLVLNIARHNHIEAMIGE